MTNEQDRLEAMVFWENIGTACSRKDASPVSLEVKLQRTIDGLKRKDEQIANAREVGLQAEVENFISETKISG